MSLMSQSSDRWALKCVVLLVRQILGFLCTYCYIIIQCVCCCVLFLLWFNSEVLLHTGNASIVQTASQRTAEIKATEQCAGMCIRVFQNHHDNINLKKIYIRYILNEPFNIYLMYYMHHICSADMMHV